MDTKGHNGCIEHAAKLHKVPGENVTIGPPPNFSEVEEKFDCPDIQIGKMYIGPLEEKEARRVSTEEILEAIIAILNEETNRSIQQLTERIRAFNTEMTRLGEAMRKATERGEAKSVSTALPDPFEIAKVVQSASELLERCGYEEDQEQARYHNPKFAASVSFDLLPKKSKEQIAEIIKDQQEVPF